MGKEWGCIEKLGTYNGEKGWGEGWEKLGMRIKWD